MKSEREFTRSTGLARFCRSLTTAFLSKRVQFGALALLTALTSLGLASTFTAPPIQASDHDDGDIDVRSRALSLTDLYVFREKDQNPQANADSLIFVMNTNPRSLARQQYYFSTNARYEFRVSRVANKNTFPTGVSNLTFRFEFGPPNAANRQPVKVTLVNTNGVETVISNTIDGKQIRTTAITEAGTPIINNVKFREQNVAIFAGLREDPFFFDVEQFFRVRAGALGTGDPVGFRPADQALDFTKGYNVNTIAMRVPLSLLQGQQTDVTTFDVWLSLRIRNPQTGVYQQTEQLARPGINEALLVSKGNLAKYNRIQPTNTSSPEMASIAAEATKTLKALGNTDAQVGAIVRAFLPDVMRIDTTIPSGFATAVNNKGSLIGGRKLSDDVIDAALSVLVPSETPLSDNVDYDGEPGNPATGHKPLETSFPYLALPN